MHFAVLPAATAVIVTFPALFPFTTPRLSTVAMLLSDDFHDMPARVPVNVAFIDKAFPHITSASVFSRVRDTLPAGVVDLAGLDADLA